MKRQERKNWVLRV